MSCASCYWQAHREYYYAVITQLHISLQQLESRTNKAKFDGNAIEFLLVLNKIKLIPALYYSWLKQKNHQICNSSKKIHIYIHCCDISVTDIIILASVAKNVRAPAPINVWKKCGRMPVMCVSAWDYASVTLTECPVLSWLLPNVKVDL